ncbi:MAG: DNA polymerase III subunit beta [bacterium]
MRCQVEREVFAEILATVAGALPGRTTYPVLQNVLLEVSGGKVSVSGTDIDTTVRKDFPVLKAGEDGQVLVPGRKLLEAVRELGVADAEFRTKDRNLHIETSNSRAMLAGLDPGEFPEVPKLPEGVALELSIAAIFDLFDNAAFAASRDDSRPAMSGINWEISRTEMRMVATDGHRLSLVQTKSKQPAAAKVLIPPKPFSLLPRGGDVVTLYVDPARVGLVTEDTVVISRQLEGPYPDYTRVIPKDKKLHRAVVGRELLNAALRRAAVFAHPVGRLTAFTFAAGKVNLHAETPEIGSSDEDVACEYEGKEIRTGFNASYVMEVLRHIGSEKVQFELEGPLAAAVVRPVDEEGTLEKTYLLMPIRLD